MSSVCYSVAPNECICGATTKADCRGVGADALEARADALVEYGDALPEGVTTEAFAEAKNLRREAQRLRDSTAASDLGKPVPVESLLDGDDFAILQEEACTSTGSKGDTATKERLEREWGDRYEQDAKDEAERMDSSSAAKIDRLREDFVLLAEWAEENANVPAGNPFAEQVAQYARARLAEWDQPLEEWEP